MIRTQFIRTEERFPVGMILQGEWAEAGFPVVSETSVIIVGSVTLSVVFNRVSDVSRSSSTELTATFISDRTKRIADAR